MAMEESFQAQKGRYFIIFLGAFSSKGLMAGEVMAHIMPSEFGDIRLFQNRFPRFFYIGWISFVGVSSFFLAIGGIFLAFAAQTITRKIAKAPASLEENRGAFLFSLNRHTRLNSIPS
jgi:hypothetical protein